MLLPLQQGAPTCVGTPGQTLLRTRSPQACRPQSCCSAPAWPSLHRTSAFKPAQALQPQPLQRLLFRPDKFQLIHKDVLNSSPESLTPTMSSLPTTELSLRGNNTRHVFILFWCSELHHTCSVLSLCPNSLPCFLFVWGLSTSNHELCSD